MPDKQQDSKDNERDRLVEQTKFDAALKKVLSVSKAESDEQMARFQAANKARRDTKKPKD